MKDFKESNNLEKRMLTLEEATIILKEARNLNPEPCVSHSENVA